MSEAPRPRSAALALAVGLVLADSSVVVLALPQIYRELDTSVAAVTWVLVSFNLVMALGAAVAVTAVLELLPATVGSERAATVVWATAGATGAALGPAIGGILTDLVSWQSIFLVQVPVALLAAVPILAVARHEAATTIQSELRRTGRPHVLANIALALV